MEYGRSFTFVTEDEHWIKKLIIGAIFILVFFLFPFLVGYQLLIARNVMDEQKNPLPEWADWGRLFLDGLKLTVGIMLYALPIILISLCAGIIVGATADSSGETNPAVMVMVILVSCLTILISLALALLVPAITIQYARTGEFGAMFKFSQVVAITRENLVNVILVVLVTGAAGFFVFLFGLIPCIGWFIIWPAGFTWITYTTGHLYGQIGHNSGLKVTV